MSKTKEMSRWKKYCEILSKEIFHIARYLLGHMIVKIERITKMNEQAHKSDTR